MTIQSTIVTLYFLFAPPSDPTVELFCVLLAGGKEVATGRADSEDGPPTGLTPNQPSRLFLNRDAHSTQCISGSFLVSIGSVLPIHVHSPSFPFHLAPQLGSLLLYRKVIPTQCLVPYQSAILHYQTSHQGLHRSLVGVFRSLIRVLSCSLKFPFSFQYLAASGLSRLFSSCCC